MPADLPERDYLIEAFDPARHDRSEFSCGVGSMDNFLKMTAKKQQRADFVRVRVMVAAGDQRIVGFHAINAHSVDAGELPEHNRRDAPRHGSIPAAYISMIAVDRRLQGRSLGKVLMADALKQILKASETLATAVVVLDVLDDGDVEACSKRYRYYQKVGFIQFTARPSRLFIAVETLRQMGSN